MYKLSTKASCTALHHHGCFTPKSLHSYPRSVKKTILQAVLAVGIAILIPMIAHAGSATWDVNPTSGDWNTASNWTPMTVPNGPADVATFSPSSTNSPSISANTEVNAIAFPVNSGYTITVNPSVTLTLSGRGVIGTARFVTAHDAFFHNGTIAFSNRSTAGNATIILNPGGSLIEGSVTFADRSTAGNADIDFTHGVISFSDSSTAGDAHIFGIECFLGFGGSSTAGNADIVISDFRSSLTFSGTSSAGNATIGSSAYTTFSESSTASNATIGVLGENLIFLDSSQGGRAQIELTFGSDRGVPAILYIAGHNSPGVTIGSIDGDEGNLVFLGANNLTVGSNNLSTTFSGVIEDEGFSGSLTKMGKGTLDLKGANTYTGQTNVNGGVLQVDGSISSNTFINNKGALAGVGTVYGNVTSYGGDVSPGDPVGVPGVLTVSSNYTQTPSGNLVIQIAGTDPGQASVLNVLGNVNLNGELDPELVNGFVPAIGQSFTFLDYTSVTGSFSHVKNPVFDHGTKRWSLVYGPTGVALVVVNNGRQDSH